MTGCQQAQEPAATQQEQQKAAPMIDAPTLASADNFRDIAGIDTAYTVDGGFLQPGVVYRSNALTVTDEDLATLEDLDIATVIDLRTPQEAAEKPDRVPEGATYINVDIFGGGTTAANPNEDFKVTTPEEAAQMLTDVNIGFIEDAGQRKQFGQVLTTIAEADGPVLFHCTAGKDRAGWTSALLQLAAGANERDVMANYLATNEFSQESITATRAQIAEAAGEDTAAAYGVLLGVQEGYLQASLDGMNEKFGGIDGYLSDGLGLDDATLEQLREKLIVS